MVRIWRLVVAVSLLGALATVGCGKSDVGEECNTADDCKDGLVCTRDWQGVHCRAPCTSQDQCPPGFDCNGVEGTNVKSCQPVKP